MIQVVVIVPYTELLAQAEEAVRAHARTGVKARIVHAYGTGVKRLDFAKADIILARGLTRQALAREYPEAAVLELAVSGYDIIRAVKDCLTDRAARKIAVMAADSVLHDVEALREIVNVDLKFFRVHDEKEILAALEEAGRDGFDAVAGGLTACTLARERGWRASLIRTSAETLQHSIKEAMNTAAVMRGERAKAEISRAILDNAREAIIYFDDSGVLSLFNPGVPATLNLPPERCRAGKRAAEIFDDPEILDLILNRREGRGLIKNLNQAALVCDIVPVRVAGQAIGVICTFQRVHDIQAAESRIRRELNKKGLVARYSFADIIHASPALAETITIAAKYAEADANVLLVGETGVGKELFAQSVHNASRRQARPFVAVNCGAFPVSLLESELFGYVEGAFSGAAKGGRIGLFELAHGGTLFLDEIGEIPLNLQASLLRALQEGEIRRIGDDRVVPVDVRIIAATNRDLRENLAEGRFRLDLLYRLEVLSLVIPPLRERREDIARIANHCLAHYRRKYRKPGLALAPDALAALAAHDWPGNIRELENVCERLAVLADSDAAITREQVEKLLRLPSSPVSPVVRQPDAANDKTGSREEASGNLEELVKFTNSLRVNKDELAKMLGISRTTLWRRTHRT
ncbi:MAG: sigma 54-interacting transcriptional regulator [Planctomycetota bacterium]|jgi:propionate catabolism operon transcriptional regulator|nr:sigma 54-interacting transcriptional regulator [Planctomycetota bacterium]